MQGILLKVKPRVAIEEILFIIIHNLGINNVYNVCQSKIFQLLLVLLIVEKSQKEILDKFNLSDMTSNLCLDKRLYSRELSKAERSKHDKFQASGSPGSPGFSTGSRQEYLESIIDYLTPDDVRCLIRAEDELVQATHFSRIFPTQVNITTLLMN